ncbi:MAG: threonine synthase [Pyrinomonadaceae bacterium]|nr:threonine synthase [Pyrinomonadaceae bacterium]
MKQKLRAIRSRGTSAGNLQTAARTTATQRCINPSCGARFDINERIYVCSSCGGLLDVVQESTRDPEQLQTLWTRRLASFESRDRSGVWRYRELLPFADDAPIVSLAEGNTPIYDAPISAAYCGLHALNLKHQGCNPTGSFKDTGMTVAITQALILGAKTVVCASTGNTAASLAAYAARAKLQCAILVPRGQISHAKLAQSLDYGAAVLELDGNFDDAMRVIRELAEDESIYLVNSINPFRIEGQKTVAAELLHQRGWRIPDHVVVPGGNLGNSTALGKGFAELMDLGLIDRLPRLSVVQAEGAGPFANLFKSVAGSAGVSTALLSQHSTSDWSAWPALTPIEDPHTLATAIKIGAPVSWQKSLRAVLASGGTVLSVSEQEMADAKAIIGREGVGCEPASASTVAGIRRLVADGVIGPDEDVVAVLTGHVLKDTDYVIKYHQENLFSDGDVLADRRKVASTYRNPPTLVKATREAIIEGLRRHTSTQDTV